MKRFDYKKQSGAALFVSLILLFALTIIGLSAAQRSNMQQRMAVNVHLSNAAFTASESAIAAFVNEANTADKTDANYVLNKLRLHLPLEDKQFDKTGGRVEEAIFDSDNGDSIVASIEASEINSCDKTCGGYSLGVSRIGTNVGCRNFIVEGKGTLLKDGVEIKSQQTTLWAREITACL